MNPLLYSPGEIKKAIVAAVSVAVTGIVASLGDGLTAVEAGAIAGAAVTAFFATFGVENA